MKNEINFPALETLNQLKTPCYIYNTALLEQTLNLVCQQAEKYDYEIHYAIKANYNPKILQQIARKNWGADCVSGGEVEAALAAGFPANKIVFAGVGKADWEINLALDHNIFCLNVESLAELLVINELAEKKNKIAPIALRINPEVAAQTHHYITTGLKENKFGINLDLLDNILEVLPKLKNISFIGIHFHIGSQIMDMDSFYGLCIRVNEIQEKLNALRLLPKHVNMGGGLGIDYRNPNKKNIPDFENYFQIFHQHLKRYNGQQVHFELGRSIVGQCGYLLSKVLYVKEGSVKKFAILDAGMTELIRPALYQAVHQIENISSDKPSEKYDVVGPICESSDCFGKEVELNEVSRNDLIVIYSAGAYGEAMAFNYNCRKLPESYFFEK